MSKKATLVLLLSLLVPIYSFAETKAIIEGPETVEIGDLVILDGSSSTDAECYEWALVNSTKTFLPVENKTKVVFSSGKPGKYTFMLVVAGIKDNKPVVSLATKTITIGDAPVPPDPPDPGPGPTPNPNTPDDKFSNLQKKVVEIASRLPVDAKRLLPATATVYRTAAIGLENTTLINASDAVKYAQTERARIWGSQAPTFGPFITEIGGIWNRHWPMTKDDVILFFNLVASGLENTK